MKINFHFGNKRSDRNQLIILFLVLPVIITGLSKCSGVNEKSLWELLDEVQRKFFPQGPINELIIKDPELLDRRVKRDVDRAIEKVIPEYDKIIRKSDSKFKPRYIEEENDERVCYTDDCKALAPPMRLCSPVVEGINCDFPK